MAEDDTLKLRKRFEELSTRAERTGVREETKFLNMAEQSVLLSMPVSAELYGGYEGAERRIAVFGGGDAAEPEYRPPIVCVRIRPASKRFADELTHRDFLGSLMALGITREVLGDIIVRDGEGWLFCLSPIAPFIIENLREVKRTQVRCEEAPPPETAEDRGETRSIVIASERLDAVIAAVYRLPREEAKALCEKGLVYINAKLAEKGGAAIPENAVVSVRGRGRFRFSGADRTTRKGRIRANVTIY